MCLGSSFPAIFPGNRKRWFAWRLRPPAWVLSLELWAMKPTDILRKSFPGPCQKTCVDFPCFDRLMWPCLFLKHKSRFSVPTLPMFSCVTLATVGFFFELPFFSSPKVLWEFLPHLIHQVTVRNKPQKQLVTCETVSSSSSRALSRTPQERKQDPDVWKEVGFVKQEWRERVTCKSQARRSKDTWWWAALKLHQEAREAEATAHSFLGLWEVAGKSVFTKTCQRRAGPQHWGSWLWCISSSESCSTRPCWAFVKYPVRLEQSTLLWCMKNILAKRSNAKAERAKIRPSGSVWLCRCVHRLLTWHPPHASLPAVGLLRAQVTCAEGKEVLLPLAPRGDDKCFWAYVTATWSSRLSNT